MFGWSKSLSEVPNDLSPQAMERGVFLSDFARDVATHHRRSSSLTSEKTGLQISKMGGVESTENYLYSKYINGQPIIAAGTLSGASDHAGKLEAKITISNEGGLFRNGVSAEFSKKWRGVLEQINKGEPIILFGTLTELGVYFADFGHGRTNISRCSMRKCEIARLGGETVIPAPSAADLNTIVSAIQSE
ncbi:MAG: hypothetical protein JJ931_11800 [Henriciella sp.]|nr:hypothetical protein [Henriciella sp.]MBO6696092.1 hypothetical protein [Henriciella sp.]